MLTASTIQGRCSQRVTKANFEGIRVTNAAEGTISGNLVTGNDKGLNPADLTCPGIPAFETAGGFDCGEGSQVHPTVLTRARGQGRELLTTPVSAPCRLECPPRLR
jgi:hypothetical protein